MILVPTLRMLTFERGKKGTCKGEKRVNLRRTLGTSCSSEERVWHSLTASLCSQQNGFLKNLKAIFLLFLVNEMKPLQREVNRNIPIGNCSLHCYNHVYTALNMSLLTFLLCILRQKVSTIAVGAFLNAKYEYLHTSV